MSTTSEHDGPISKKQIPLCAPEIRGNEWAYLRDCLDSNWVSSVGTYVNRFEEQLAQRVGTRHGVATVNGTAALHIALLVANVRPDDEVLVSTLTFIAPVNAIRYAGAWPVFVDAEPEHWQMDVQKLTDWIEQQCRWKNGALHNRRTGRRVKAILPVHILGHPVEMQPLLELARKYNLTVIEDATESLGAYYRSRPVGQFGELACFSFNGNKMITTGGGGMLVTDKRDLAERARYLTTQAKDDGMEYIHREIGYNYRLTNLQAAMGCAQLEQLDDYIQAKRSIAEKYNQAFENLPGITLPQEASWAHSTCWMYTLLVHEQQYGSTSREMIAAFQKQGIQSRPLWQPGHCSPVYRECESTDCSVADRLYARAISLPCSVGLQPEDQERVVEAVQAGAMQLRKSA